MHDTEGKRLGMVAGLTNETTWAWLDDERFVVAGADQDLRLGDCSTFQLGAPIDVHLHRVSTLAKFDDEHILSASVNGALRIVSIQSLFPQYDLIRAFDGPVRRVVWSPSGTCIAATGQGKFAKVWNANSLVPEPLIVKTLGREAAYLPVFLPSFPARFVGGVVAEPSPDDLCTSSETVVRRCD